MSQCPVPAVPESPMLLVTPELDWTSAEVAEWERQLETVLAAGRRYYRLLPSGFVPEPPS